MWLGLHLSNFDDKFIIPVFSHCFIRNYFEKLSWAIMIQYLFPIEHRYFFNIGSRPLFLKWNDQNNLPIKQAATIAMTIMHTKNRIGTCTVPWHFLDGHFLDGHFLDGHFLDGQILDRVISGTLFRQVNKTGHFLDPTDFRHII